MPEELQIIATEDGSNTLFNTALKETYHSTRGAIQESNHVFINNGLRFFLDSQKPNSISVFEVGLGTGLNALLSLKFAEENKLKIEYTSIECNPIALKTAAQLNFVSLLNDESLTSQFQRIHDEGWDQEVILSNHFMLQKINNDLFLFQLKPNQFDVIFFDAFAPSKQPEMWAMAILEKVVQSMKEGGVFVTYCAKGQLKRDLKSLGLIVESLPGSSGKREMVRALKGKS